MPLHRLGAAAYVCWGLFVLHAALDTAELAAGLPSPMGIIIGTLAQQAWTLAAVGTAVMWAAIALLWRKDRYGYWVTLALSGFVEIGYLVFVLLPGYQAPGAGPWRPVVWVLAVALSSSVLRRGTTNDAQPSG